MAVNTQTGTSYTLQQSDMGNLVYFTNNGTVTVTLPATMVNGVTNCWLFLWEVDIEYAGTGFLILTPPNGVTIDGATSLTLSENQGVRLFWDGTNYKTQRGLSGWVDTLPANSSSAGLKGQYTSDGLFLYICVADNTWRKVGVSSF